jgi:hypothetical protein
MNNDTKLAILTDKLPLPSPEQLSPWLEKLIKDPESLVIIAIEKPLRVHGPHIGVTWLSAKERLQVRNALKRINVERQKKREQQTNEIPIPAGSGYTSRVYPPESKLP